MEDELRGETTVETIANIVNRYFGDSIDVPEDVIGALLVLAAKIGSVTSLPDADATVIPDSEIDALIDRGTTD